MARSTTMPQTELTLAPGSTRPKRLGERLLEAGYLSQTQLDLALREQKRRGGLIGQVLVGLGFVPQEIISAFVAKEAETKVANVNRGALPAENGDAQVGAQVENPHDSDPAAAGRSSCSVS